MQKLIDYLMERYRPETFLLYGSYADGTWNEGSDFDAMLIADCTEPGHDVSIVDGVQLDVFLYPLDAEFLPEEYPMLYHGKVIFDKAGMGEILLSCVKTYIDGQPRKTAEEIRNDLAWCEKMLRRTQRRDAEGYYRWHWLLCDSLEFYSDIRGSYYFGPKKTLKWMEGEDAEAFRIYSDALACMEESKLEKWIAYLKKQMEG